MLVFPKSEFQICFNNRKCENLHRTLKTKGGSQKTNKQQQQKVKLKKKKITETPTKVNIHSGTSNSDSFQYGMYIYSEI